MNEDDYAALYHAAKRQAREAVTNQDPGSHPWLTLERAEEIQIIAAIGAAVAEERASSAETAMLAYQWMKRHDALLAWIQDNPSRLTDFVASGPRPPSPSPADLPNAIAEAVAEERTRWREWLRAAAAAR